eukprot:54248-Pelagomonas_calceolata.AAC.1
MQQELDEAHEQADTSRQEVQRLQEELAGTAQASQGQGRDLRSTPLQGMSCFCAPLLQASILLNAPGQYCYSGIVDVLAALTSYGRAQHMASCLGYWLQ